MTFDTWIKNAGPKTIAQRLKVDPSTVSNWRTGKAFPRPEKIEQIYKLTFGKVTHREIVRHYLELNRK